MSKPKIVIHNHYSKPARDAREEIVFSDGDKGKYPSLLEATKQAKK